MNDLNKRNRLVVIIDYVNIPEAIALQKFFEQMEVLGNLGASRWLGFYSDGDGAFHPKVRAFIHDYSLPQSEKKMRRIEDAKGIELIGIDADSIAWELYKKEEEQKEKDKQQAKLDKKGCENAHS